jgi:hypothetical protein
MKLKLLVANSVILLVSASSQAATILAQEDFAGTSADLGGTAADVGGTWQATTNYNADGSLTSVAAGGSAILAFTPASGFMYEVSATVTLASSASTGIGIGFANKLESAWASNTPASNNALRFANASTPGYAWMWASGASAVQNIAGDRGTNLIATTAVTGLTHNMKVVLDTTQTNWTIAWYVGNVLQASTTLNGSLGLAGSGTGGTTPDFSAIDSVGFTNFGTSPGTIDNFVVTSAVPEPGAALLGGFGIIALLRRRRF